MLRTTMIGGALVGMAANPTLETLRTTVETQARGMVMDGKVAMGSGRENARAAGECARARLE